MGPNRAPGCVHEHAIGDLLSRSLEFVELTRKDLKTDKFAEEVTHGFEFITAHTAEVKKYGAIVVVVAILAGGILYYRNHQAGIRAEALSQALRIANARVGPPAPPALTFPTQDAKDQARNKALADVKTQYHGTNEGAIAGLYYGVSLADKGDVTGAEKEFRDVADSAPKDLAAVGSLSLAQTLASEGKDADAEKILRDLANKPTALVSKEQAQIELAQIIAKRDKAEAMKILNGLSNSRPSVSQTVVTVMGNIQNN
jgi:predicted negative regulator of RcsB-dependent stress response